MEERLSFCEILELAVQIEKNGRDFYEELSEITEDEDATKVFKFLAKAEDMHILIFREMSSKSCDYNPAEAYPDEYFFFMNSMADQHVFTQKGKGQEIAKEVKTYSEGVELGIQFEEDSIIFYEGLKKMLSEEDQGKVESIIVEEKKHLTWLRELRGESKDEKREGV